MKKNFLGKLISGILAFGIFFTSLDTTAFVYAAESQEETVEENMLVVFDENGNKRYISESRFLSMVENTDENAEEFVAEESNASLDFEASAEELAEKDDFFEPESASVAETAQTAYPSTNPLKYLVDTYPATRNQNPYGTCWAHSVVASAEFDCVKNNVVSTGSDTDFSELQLAYFTYHSVVDPLGGLSGDSYGIDQSSASAWLTKGGNVGFAVVTLNQWVGLANESDVVSKNGLIGGAYDDKYAYKSAVKLTDYRELNIEKNPEAVKAAIVSNGAVCISYYSNAKYYGADSNGWANYYHAEEQGNSNHAIVIVGWNDNYSKESFKYTPEGNGAWLARNSWTTQTGYTYTSYFWISYYDPSIVNIAYSMNFTAASTYDNNYQYDGSNSTACCHSSGWTASGVSENQKYKAANMFTAHSGASQEILKAVNVTWDYSNMSYTIQVYVDPKTDNPSSGTLVDTVTGTTTYPGAYTISLNKDIVLKEGQKFSVVVTSTNYYMGMEGYSTPSQEMSLNFSGWTKGTTTAKKGESYLWENQKWNPIVASGKTARGNFCIKAFTKNVGTPSKSFTVHYEANGGKGTMQDVSYLKGKTAVISTNRFSRTGYTFTGWNTQADGNGATYKVGAKVTTDTTLYAIWKPVSVSITLNANGGKVSAKNIYATYGTRLGTIPTPTKAGYTFVGWFTTSTGGTEVTEDTISTFAKAATIYARWKGDAHLIYFDANGGAVSTAIMDVSYGSKVGTLPTPTQTGSKFTGWYTAKTGGKAITASTVYQYNSDITLYARWSLYSYSIKYSLNGGTNAKNITKYNANTNETLLSAKRKGYDFMGWYLDSKYTKRIQTISLASLTGLGVPLSNLTLYAKWSPKNYTVKFDANGGTLNGAASFTAVYNTKIGDLSSTASHTEYDFGGWYTKKSGGTKLTAAYVWKDENITTVYARWVPKKWTINYVLDGGKNNSGNPAYYNVSSKKLTLKSPTKNGYIFAGWYSNADFTGNKVTAFSCAIGVERSFYAKWTPITYTIKFDSNGASGKLAGITTSYGETAQLPACHLTRSGYQFMGWASSKSAAANGTVKYANCANVKNLTSRNGGTITLYAVWKKL